MDCSGHKENPMYATKRRRRSVKLQNSITNPTVTFSMTSVASSNVRTSNPSKRHRDRLNAEIEQLARLLPVDSGVITRLDKLSVLRLAVSYLRIESYFSAIGLRGIGSNDIDKCLNSRLQQRIHYSGRATPFDGHLTDSSNLLQAIDGFLLIVTADHQVFYASQSVQDYTGLHQSDVIHQSALELVHAEDRDKFKSQVVQPSSNQNSVLTKGVCQSSYRCFTVRFRCLLPDASGFVTMEVSGLMKPLPGQRRSRGAETLLLAFFAICCPLSQLVVGNMPCSLQNCKLFRTKYKLDMSIIALDKRARKLLNYEDRILAEKRVYDLLHPDDLKYYSAGHKKLLATGHAGLVAYRMFASDLSFFWVQTNARVMYKNGQADFILATHACLSPYEGQELLRNRDNVYKLPYPLGKSKSYNVESPLKEKQTSPSKTITFPLEHSSQLGESWFEFAPTSERLHSSIETVQDTLSSTLHNHSITKDEAVRHTLEQNSTVFDKDFRACNRNARLMEEPTFCTSSSHRHSDRYLFSSSFVALLNSSHVPGFGGVCRKSTLSPDALTSNLTLPFDIGQSCDAPIHLIQRQWSDYTSVAASHCAVTGGLSDAAVDHDKRDAVKVLKLDYVDPVTSQESYDYACSQKIATWNQHLAAGISTTITQDTEYDRWFSSSPNDSGSEPTDTRYLKNPQLFSESHHQRACATTGYVGI